MARVLCEWFVVDLGARLLAVVARSRDKGLACLCPNSSFPPFFPLTTPPELRRDLATAVFWQTRPAFKAPPLNRLSNRLLTNGKDCSDPRTQLTDIPGAEHAVPDLYL